MSFMKNLKETINESPYNESYTENGALGYRTTGKALLDLNFAVASMRKWKDQDIIDKFLKAYYENKRYALLWLFFASDIRGGLGERRIFRVIFKYLAENEPSIVKNLIALVPTYRRYDDLFCVYGLNDDIDKSLHSFIENKLTEDMESMKEKRAISLLAKWMPSENATNKDTRALARKFIKMLGITERQYRKMLSAMRKYLDVVEVKTCSNKWEDINYSSVPSKANLKYKDAFLKHDRERRAKFLEKVARGEEKINSSVLFPHDIVSKYYSDNHYGWSREVSPVDPTLEELWNALPDYVQGESNTIAVIDGSGSMTDKVSGNVTALDVANGLGIYFSERCSGEFANKFITFSQHPQLVDMTNCNTLRDKLVLSSKYDEASNTDIKAVFDLILNTAISHHSSQDEIPNNILIISDMEFDNCVKFGKYGAWKVPNSQKVGLFNTIAMDYSAAGYRLPRLIFWNVNSRTGTIPVKENDLGVALVSGFSASIAKMVLSDELDPYKLVIDAITAERYTPVDEAIKVLV